MAKAVLDFSGSRVLVTGGTAGIGRGIAEAFLECGAKVIVCGRKDPGDMPTKGGRKLEFRQCDVRQASECNALVAGIARDHGGLDVLVNNAGGDLPGGVSDEREGTLETLRRRVIDANLIGAANACYCAARHMIAQGGGRIVNVSSRGAFRGEPTGPAYGASKAALNAMSQSLAKYLAPFHVTVGVVAPGFVQTDMAREALSGQSGVEIRAQSPFNRVARPEEVAYAVLFLASEGAEFMSGAIIDVNGASYLRT